MPTRGSNGAVLIYVLFVVMALSILCSTLVYVAQLALDTSKRSLLEQACSAVARGITKTIVGGYANGAKPTAKSWTLQGITVTVGSNWTGNNTDAVEVEAVEGDVSDTISFTYDTIAHKVSRWQDNGPGMTR